MLCLSGKCLDCKKRVWLDKSNGCPICGGHSFIELKQESRMPTIGKLPLESEKEDE